MNVDKLDDKSRNLYTLDVYKRKNQMDGILAYPKENLAAKGCFQKETTYNKTFKKK